MPVKNLLAAGLLAEGAILLLAALLRLWGLDIKPPHFDEGINGWFVDQMRANGFYRYDPENYHGPLYFYGLFVSLTLLGRNLWALRLPSVLAGIASVWLALRFDRFFGKGPARLAALALAVSPAAVFYGRYAIHESWLVLSLMATMLGFLGLWRDGGRRDLGIAVAGITGMLLLKETAVIHLACMALAAGCLVVWGRIVPPAFSMPVARQSWQPRDAALFTVMALGVWVFFYSGTFLNWQGVPDFFRAYFKWFQTGTGAGGHEKTEYQPGSLGFLNWYWIALMARYEWPSLFGLLVAFRMAWPAPPMTRYLSIYAVGVLAAYSVVPYKTPWCILSILWPFALLFGAGISECAKSPLPKFIAPLAAALLLGASLASCLRLNFRHFTDPKELYVYVQTQPGIALLTRPLLEMAARDPKCRGFSGEILLESYYPLPWILGEFTRIGYYGKENHPAKLSGDFVTALSSDSGEVEARLSGAYLRRRYHLRDSMEECTVWFRESLFAPWFAIPGNGTAERVVCPLPAPLPGASPYHKPGS